MSYEAIGAVYKKDDGPPPVPSAVAEEGESLLKSNGSLGKVLWSGELVQNDVESKGEILGSAMNLAGCAFGASMLSLPYTMYICGPLPAMFMIVASALLSVLAANSITNSGIRWKSSAYSGIVEKAFGKRAGISLAALVSLCLILAAISYVVGLVDFLPAIFPIFSGWSRVGKVLVVYAALFPLTLVGDLSAFGPSSLISCIGCYIQALALIIAVFGATTPMPPASAWVQLRPIGILFSLPMITLPYAFHFVLTDTFMEMKNPTIQRLQATTKLATVTLTVCYMIVALSGYLLYGGVNVSPDVLAAFGAGSIVIAIARCSIALLLFATYSLFIIPLRKKFEEQIYKEHTTKVDYRRVWISSAIGAIVIASCIVLKDLSLANTIAGGCIALIMYTIPGLLELKRCDVFPEDHTTKRVLLGWTFFAVGIFAAVIGIFGPMLPLSPDP